MANPNIVGVTTIVGITTFLNLTTTDVTLIESNASTSGKIFKINSIIVGNIDGANTANITLKIHNAAAGAGTSVSIASTISVPQYSSLAIIGKDTPLYLEENRSISVTAGAINSIDVVASYETIS